MRPGPPGRQHGARRAPPDRRRARPGRRGGDRPRGRRRAGRPGACHRGHPVACGVAVPGVVDEAAGVAVYEVGERRLPGTYRCGTWCRRGSDCRRCSATTCGVGGIAEARLGAGQDARHVLFVAIGTGIAAAHVVAGSAAVGAHGAAGEIGRILVRPDGPRCGCGRPGCLEALASASAVARRYAALADDPRPGAAGTSPGAAPAGTAPARDTVSAADVAEQAAGGELAGRSVAGRPSRRWPTGSPPGEALFDVDTMVIGGGLARAGDGATARPAPGRPARTDDLPSGAAPGRGGGPGRRGRLPRRGPSRPRQYGETMTQRVTGKVVTPTGVIRQGCVELDGERITAVAEYPAQARFVHWIVPGFVDMHTHGGGGHTLHHRRRRRRPARPPRSTCATAPPPWLASLVGSPFDLMRTATAAFAPLVREGVLAGDPLRGAVPVGGPVRGAEPGVPPRPVHRRAGPARRRGSRHGTHDHPGPRASRRAGRHQAAHLAQGGRRRRSHRRHLGAEPGPPSRRGRAIGTHLFSRMRPLLTASPARWWPCWKAPNVVCELVADRVHLHDGILHLRHRRGRPGTGRTDHRRDGRRRHARRRVRAGRPAGRRWPTGWPGWPAAGRSPAAPLTMDAALRHADHRRRCRSPTRYGWSPPPRPAPSTSATGSARSRAAVAPTGGARRRADRGPGDARCRHLARLTPLDGAGGRVSRSRPRRPGRPARRGGAPAPRTGRTAPPAPSPRPGGPARRAATCAR